MAGKTIHLDFTQMTPAERRRVLGAVAAAVQACRSRGLAVSARLAPLRAASLRVPLIFRP